jgi:hypothetical protein
MRWIGRKGGNEAIHRTRVIQALKMLMLSTLVMVTVPFFASVVTVTEDCLSSVDVT